MKQKLFLLVYILLGAVIYFGNTLLWSCIPLPPDWLSAYETVRAGFTGYPVVIALSVLLIAPCLEELMFRGLLLAVLRRILPLRLSLVLQAMLFGLYHGNPLQFCVALLPGLLFGLAAARTRSILPPLLLHISYNTAAYCVSML